MTGMTQHIDGLVSRAMSAQITRRKMLQGSLALGAGAVALGAFGGGVLTPIQEAAASPLDSDLQILNYALTLEHLEAAAYKAINDSGILATIYGGKANRYFQAFGVQEALHRDNLIATITKLGGKPVSAPARGYNLSPVPTTAAGVVDYFQVVEAVGASAYLGAAGAIKNPDILEAALSIHAVEAEHASALAQLIAPGTMRFAPESFATPRTPDQIFQIVAPFFVPTVSPFKDVTMGTDYATAIFYLYGLGIVRGDQNGNFYPGMPLLRAQMAGMVARAFLWADESYGKSTFTDQQYVDNELWNDVNVLAHYGVALGYNSREFAPTVPVLNVQDVAFVARAMVTKKFWTMETAVPAGQYPNIQKTPHGLEVATYVKHVGPVPGSTTDKQNWNAFNQNATRAFSAEVLYQALMTINKGLAS
jgi:hypothetical protein